MRYLKNVEEHLPADHSFDTKVGCGLGLASIAVGLAELAAPQRIEKLMGIGNGENTGILRVLGVREIMHGVDLLTHHDPVPGIWSRVAGDVLDNVLLAAAATRSKRLGGVALVAALVAPLVVADVVGAPALSARKKLSGGK